MNKTVGLKWFTATTNKATDKATLQHVGWAIIYLLHDVMACSRKNSTILRPYKSTSNLQNFLKIAKCVGQPMHNSMVKFQSYPILRTKFREFFIQVLRPETIYPDPFTALL